MNDTDMQVIRSALDSIDTSSLSQPARDVIKRWHEQIEHRGDVAAAIEAVESARRELDQASANLRAAESALVELADDGGGEGKVPASAHDLYRAIDVLGSDHRLLSVANRALREMNGVWKVAVAAGSLDVHMSLSDGDIDRDVDRDAVRDVLANITTSPWPISLSIHSGHDNRPLSIIRTFYPDLLNAEVTADRAWDEACRQGVR